jgi:hypothetical protein
MNRAENIIRMLKGVIVIATIINYISPALADPLYCSTWQDIHTCSSPDGYVSHETEWQGLISGDDNQGNRWTTSRWRDFTTTTVEPRPERRRSQDAPWGGAYGLKRELPGPSGQLPSGRSHRGRFQAKRWPERRGS